jgi:hypothetical protein
MRKGEKPIVLLILDGWGLASEASGGPRNSAIELADTPVWDRLYKSGEFPSAPHSGRHIEGICARFFVRVRTPSPGRPINHILRT